MRLRHAIVAGLVLAGIGGGDRAAVPRRVAPARSRGCARAAAGAGCAATLRRAARATARVPRGTADPVPSRAAAASRVDLGSPQAAVETQLAPAARGPRRGAARTFVPTLRTQLTPAAIGPAASASGAPR